MKKLLIFVWVLMAVNTYAQFSITGEIRPRFEIRNGYKNLPTDTSAFAMHISQRSRLILNFKTEKYETQFSFQDVRIWGDEILKTNDSHLAAHELWIKFNITTDFGLQIGRQILKYDNQRLVAATNFNQNGAKHDAIKLYYKKSNLNIEFVSAFNQTEAKYSGTEYIGLASNYKTLNILWMSYKAMPFSISALVVADGFQNPAHPNGIYMRFTPGIIASFESDNFGINMKTFSQTGKNQNGQNINAYFINTELFAKTTNNTKISTGFELMSGDQNKNDNEFNAFDILYGTRHKYNGKIDYFNIPSTTGNSGLIDLYVKSNYKFNSNLSILFDYHYFTTQSAYVYNDKKIDKYLGSEIDTELKYDFSKEISLSALYAIMFASESIEIIKGGDSNYFGNFFMLMLTFKPSFFSSK